MLIKNTGRQIVITIPNDNSIFKPKELKDFLDYLKYLQLMNRKKGTASLAKELADEADRNWWINNKARILGE